MNVQLRGQGTDVSIALRLHAERCLVFALRRFARRIDRVTVWLEDVNGPRGGVDKRCRIAVRLRPAGAVFVAKNAADAFAAIGRAAGRTGSAVARKIALLQERRLEGDDRGGASEPLALLVMQHGEER